MNLKKSFLALRLIRKNAIRSSVKASATLVTEKDLSYGDSKKQKLDLYRPQNAEGILPVIVNFHGDAMALGKKEYRRGFCARLAEEGYAVINVEYDDARTVGGFENSLAGTKRVFSWMTANAGKYGLDCSKVVLVGDAIGALTAFSLPLDKYEGVEIVGVMGYSGIYDVPELFSRDVKFNLHYDVIRDMFGISGKNGFTEEQASRIRATAVTRAVTPDYPAVFIAHSVFDGIAPEQGEVMVKALLRKGVPVTEFKVAYLNAGHNFHLESVACAERLQAFEREFLSRVTKGEPALNKYVEV